MCRKAGPAPPSDCPSRSMSPGSVYATSPQSGARAPRCYASLPRLGHRETPTATPLLGPNAGQTSRLCPLGSHVGSPARGSAHTTPATGPPWAAPYPYDTAVGARRVRPRTKASHARLRTRCQPFGRADQMRQATLPEPLPVLIDERPITDQEARSSPQCVAQHAPWSGWGASGSRRPPGAPSPTASAGPHREPRGLVNGHCQLIEKSLTDPFLMRKADELQAAKIAGVRERQKRGIVLFLLH